MFHTIEASLQLSNQMFYYYKEHLANLSISTRDEFYKDSSEGKGYELYKCKFLANNGIGISFLHSVHTDQLSQIRYNHYLLILVINPKRVIDGKDFLSVTTESESEFLFDEINKNLLSIGIIENFNLFSISRIDYCYNYQFESQELAERYIELLKRAALSGGFTIRQYWDKRQRRYIDYPNAVCVGSKSIIINFYNKQAQMMETFSNSPINPSLYDGIVRFEVQCLKPKVNSLRLKYGLPSYQPCYYASEEISRYVLSYYINKIFCKGDFYTLSEAKERVLLSNYRDETKNSMLLLLEKANERRSLQRAVWEMSDLENYRYGYGYIDRLLSKFDEIGVNPVTIPERWKITYFPNPIKLMGNQN